MKKTFPTLRNTAILSEVDLPFEALAILFESAISPPNVAQHLRVNGAASFRVLNHPKEPSANARGNSWDILSLLELTSDTKTLRQIKSSVNARNYGI